MQPQLGALGRGDLVPEPEPSHDVQAGLRVHDSAGPLGDGLPPHVADPREPPRIAAWVCGLLIAVMLNANEPLRVYTVLWLLIDRWRWPRRHNCAHGPWSFSLLSPLLSGQLEG